VARSLAHPSGLDIGALITLKWPGQPFHAYGKGVKLAVNAGGVICAAAEYRDGTRRVAFEYIDERIRANVRAVLEERRSPQDASADCRPCAGRMPGASSDENAALAMISGKKQP